MLLAVDFDEYFIDMKGVTVTSVLSLQPLGVFGSELDAPKPDGFIADDNPAFSEQILYISMA